MKGDTVLIGDGTSLQPGYVVYNTSSGLIEEVLSEPPDNTQIPILAAEIVTPGFCDIHLHGIGGSKEMITFWGDPGYTLSRLPAFGTTSCMASLILPGIKEDYDKVMEGPSKALNKVIGKTGLGAVARGIHVEGPIITSRGGLPDPGELVSMKVA